MSLQLTQRWRVLRGNLSDHLCWLIDDSGKKAVMKRARDRSEKKLIEPFNEVVCSELAGLLGTAVTETHLDRVDGEPVVLSLVVSELNFSYVLSNNLTFTPENIQFMSDLLVTDWWLANTDRTAGKNDHLVIVKTATSFAPCPIDYSHALNGCSGEMFTLTNANDPNRIQAASYNHISEPYVRSIRDLQPAIKRVQAIDDQTIGRIVDGAVSRIAEGRPANETTVLQSNAETVKALLRARRDALPESLMEWCRAKGKSAA